MEFQCLLDISFEMLNIFMCILSPVPLASVERG